MIINTYNLLAGKLTVTLNTGIDRLNDMLDDEELLLKILNDFKSKSKSTDFNQYDWMAINGLCANENINLPTVFSVSFGSKTSPVGTYFKPVAFDHHAEYPRLRDEMNFLLNTLFTKIINDNFEDELRTMINKEISKLFDKSGVTGLDKMVGTNVINRKLAAQALNEEQLITAYTDTGNPAFLPKEVQDIFLF